MKNLFDKNKKPLNSKIGSQLTSTLKNVENDSRVNGTKIIEKDGLLETVVDNKKVDDEIDELQYTDNDNEVIVDKNLNGYELIRYVLKKKIEKYNEINLMKKQERKEHIRHFNIFNNFLENGLLLPPEKMDPIFRKKDEVIKFKKKMKMNIILTIITYDLKDLFILQKKFLKDTNQIKDYSFYSDFDLENEWIYFCICVYDKLKKLKNIKDKKIPIEIIDKDDVLDIINEVDNHDLKFIKMLKEKITGFKEMIFNYLKTNSQNFLKFIQTINYIKEKIKNLIIKKETDCVRELFSEFMLILFQYTYYPDKFPIKINTLNVGDSTKLQKYFDDYIEQQNKFYFQDFDNKIEIAYLEKEITNETDPNRIQKKIEEYKKRLEESKIQQNNQSQSQPQDQLQGQIQSQPQDQLQGQLQSQPQDQLQLQRQSQSQPQGKGKKNKGKGKDQKDVVGGVVTFSSDRKTKRSKKKDKKTKKRFRKNY